MHVALAEKKGETRKFSPLCAAWFFLLFLSGNNIGSRRRYFGTGDFPAGKGYMGGDGRELACLTAIFAKKKKEEKMEGLDRVFGRKVLILEKGRGGGG